VALDTAAVEVSQLETGKGGAMLRISSIVGGSVTGSVVLAGAGAGPSNAAMPAEHEFWTRRHEGVSEVSDSFCNGVTRPPWCGR
jgi:hypothetical protein